MLGIPAFIFALSILHFAVSNASLSMLSCDTAMGRIVLINHFCLWVTQYSIIGNAMLIKLMAGAFFIPDGT